MWWWWWVVVVGGGGGGGGAHPKPSVCRYKPLLRCSPGALPARRSILCAVFIRLRYQGGARCAAVACKRGVQVWQWGEPRFSMGNQGPVTEARPCNVGKTSVATKDQAKGSGGGRQGQCVVSTCAGRVPTFEGKTIASQRLDIEGDGQGPQLSTTCTPGSTTHH